MHSTIVVGGGLIGAAAARHLTRMGEEVALIAPEEPKDRQGHTGVFASHYDEGRITRILDPDAAWATTAARSIARYAEIEADSGIPFFSPAGFLYFKAAGSDALAMYDSVGTSLGAQFDRLDTAGLRGRFPYLSFPDDTAGLHEHETAGYVSPRKLAAAQIEAARRGGATLVRSPAVRVTPVTGGVEVETAEITLRGRRALVAAGGFTNAWGLVPKPLDLKVFARTVVLIRVEGAVLAELADMPSLVGAGAYLLPPIRYPDGQVYVKIGVGTDADERLETAADLDRWFKGTGSADNRAEFLEIITTLIPCLKGLDAVHTDTCVTSYSPHGLPMIDWLDDDHRIAVAVAGNGKGAKSSDDWGYAAALLVSGRDWDHPIAPDRLRAAYS
ncbi:MAG: FAD-dependent oxidoreductase [Alphaproteobacteria bacterium]|nr:FAD-dependent oxidoreductase [Alphaproteobacteria bacterium]